MTVLGSLPEKVGVLGEAVTVGLPVACRAVKTAAPTGYAERVARRVQMAVSPAPRLRILKVMADVHPAARVIGDIDPRAKGLVGVTRRAG